MKYNIYELLPQDKFDNKNIEKLKMQGEML